MFKTVDVLIGFTLVMLIVSLAVTVMTEVIARVANMRGHALKGGIAELLRLLDYEIDEKKAELIADQILRDPLVAQRSFLPWRYHLAAVVHREELTRLLLGFGANQRTYAQTPRVSRLSKDELAKLRTEFRASLKTNGIANPDETLIEVRAAAVALELTAPALSNAERVNAALLNFAASDFLGKLNGWFDQTIDRVADAFTQQARIVGAMVAVVVAVALQLDSFGVINRLSVDDALRSQAVKWAVEHQDDMAKAAGQNDTVAAARDPASKAAAAKTIAEEQGKATNNVIKSQLSQTELLPMPRSFEAWTANWKGVGGKGLLGIALSAILLSLGAPFWFEALQNLVKLRSVTAVKDDAQRQHRQTSQAPDDASKAGAGPQAPPDLPLPYAGGEAGDLTAVG
jgi:hypothetical protein